LNNGENGILRAMSTFETLANRKQRIVKARLQSIENLCDDLQVYARAYSGQFILFGSSVSGDITENSDVDLIIDFPPDRETAAWQFAESACWKNGLKPDIKPLRFCNPQFISRILKTSKTIK
jgi:predicted nucleotidyltransferase